ncbi:MAG: hypothetical protein B7X39_17700 [Lysobacterales bacterium 14-68-21]|jgi:hypothetical protein|nr:MAG: hypothetical protein B7X45_16215 [Xanthomonadales bacterium 15-68-25]OZB64064.1 MAG: hypothetical protein B7X39_17700 [Xanthomonadales bacterium 14-68-21]
MKNLQRVFGLCIAAGIAWPAVSYAAGPREMSTIELLARASGLTERQVQMVLGNRTAFAEYRANYDAVDRRFQTAVGPQLYRHLKSDAPLTRQQIESLVAMMQARDDEAQALASR